MMPAWRQTVQRRGDNEHESEHHKNAPRVKVKEAELQKYKDAKTQAREKPILNEEDTRDKNCWGSWVWRLSSMSIMTSTWFWSKDQFICTAELQYR
jgi:hypothetical protein